MNFIEGELTNDNGETKFVSQDVTLAIPTDRLPKETQQNVILGIRPEDISITQGNEATMNSFERHGDHTDIFLMLSNGTKLSARQHGTHEEAEGGRVNAAIDASKVHFFSCHELGTRV